MIELPRTKPDTNGWKLVGKTCQHLTKATQVGLVNQADMLLRDGKAPEDITAGIERWLNRPGARPGLLPHLVSDVIRENRQTTEAPPIAGNDREVAEILQRGKRLADQARAAQQNQPALPPSILESSA